MGRRSSAQWAWFQRRTSNVRCWSRPARSTRAVNSISILWHGRRRETRFAARRVKFKPADVITMGDALFRRVGYQHAPHGTVRGERQQLWVGRRRGSPGPRSQASFIRLALSSAGELAVRLAVARTFGRQPPALAVPEHLQLHHQTGRPAAPVVGLAPVMRRRAPCGQAPAQYSLAAKPSPSALTLVHAFAPHQKNAQAQRKPLLPQGRDERVGVTSTPAVSHANRPPRRLAENSNGRCGSAHEGFSSGAAQSKSGQTALLGNHASQRRAMRLQLERGRLVPRTNGR